LYDFLTNLIANNLTLFMVFFHELNIDLNQFSQLMLILYPHGRDGKNYVNSLY